MRKVLCILTVLMMMVSIAPATIFATSGDVLEGDMGIEDSIFDNDDDDADKDEPTQPDNPSKPDEPTTPSNPTEPEDDDKACTHNYMRDKVITKATPTKDGTCTLLCNTCGASEEGIIAKASNIGLKSPKAIYNGKTKKPVVVVKDAEGNVISADNYKVSYSKSIKKLGTYKVTVTFKGDTYEGKESTVFAVVPPAPKKASVKLRTVKGGYDDVVMTWSKVKGAAGYEVYYKKASDDEFKLLKRTTKTTLTKKNLDDGVKYYFRVVPYIKDGKTIYASTKYKATNVYTLKKVSTPKVVKSGSKVKVSWTNISGEGGYEISVAPTKKGTNVVAKYKTTTGKYKKLSVKKGANYYKVRAYRTYKINGVYKTVYGPWSGVKEFTK